MKKTIINEMTSGKSAFQITNELFAIVTDLEPEETHDLMMAIHRYQLGEDLEVDRNTALLFRPFKVYFDQADKRYMATKKKLAEAGRKGGKAKASKAKQGQVNSSDAKQGLAGLSDAKQGLAMLSDAKRTVLSCTDLDCTETEKKIEERGSSSLPVSSSIFPFEVFEQAGKELGIPEEFCRDLYAKIVESSGLDAKGLPIKSPVRYLKTCYDSYTAKLERSKGNSSQPDDIETELWKIGEDMKKTKALIAEINNKPTRQKNSIESKELRDTLKKRLNKQTELRNELLRKSVA